MKIALLHPTYWPEVRRGSERLIHDLALALGRLGHDVTILTTHAGSPSRVVEDSTEVDRRRRPPQLPGLTPYEHHVLTIPGAIERLVRGDFHVAHAFFPTDSWAAVNARRLGGPPVVATMHGVPTRSYLVARRFRLEMLKDIVAGADECTVLSQAAAKPFRRYLFREPVVLPGGVDTARFARTIDRQDRPTLFSASSLGDPRKRADLLFSAWESVIAGNPDARLQMATTRDPFMSTLKVSMPPGVEAIRPDAKLAESFASAWATVNAAPGEAFGLVLLESLAAGTPIICDDSGAGPEILGSAEVGRVFAEGDEADLAAVMTTSLAAPPGRGMEADCVLRAAEFDWSRVVVKYEAIYDRVGR